MLRSIACLFSLAWVLAAHGGDRDPDRDLKDLHFAEAFFHARQGDYFGALQRMDAELAQHYAVDEPELDTLHYHVGEAEFSVGDFELNYRMHHRAGRAITAVLEGSVDPAVRNEAAYRLARIHFQKGQMADALHALDRIEGRIPADVEDEARFLRANIYLTTGRPEAAAKILRDLQSKPAFRGYAAYNLGIALWRAGDQAKALVQLDRAGTIKVGETSDRAIRDKANLVLGSLMMDGGAFDRAATPLERVRLEGPFSNQALLSSGWAAMSGLRHDRAVVPWNLLVQRDPTDAAVQEALLALPYAYSQLEVHGRAAVLYGRALDAFGTELLKLDASIASIEEGRFLEALIREEIHKDRNWVVKLRELPESPETFYLSELLASHDFQNALQNYLDLEELRERLSTWRLSFGAYDDLVQARLAYYTPILPAVDNEFRTLDSRMRVRMQQQEILGRRLQDLLVMPRPEVLATTEERLADVRLNSLREQLQGRTDDQAESYRQRLQRLQGVLTWRLHTNYHARLTDFHNHLEELQGAVDELRDRYAAYVRVRQAASHSYQGYDAPFKRLETRVDAALEAVAMLMARQGRALEEVAVAELEVRRERLQAYQHQARYAMADSYDRATKSLQASAE